MNLSSEYSVNSMPCLALINKPDPNEENSKIVIQIMDTDVDTIYSESLQQKLA